MAKGELVRADEGSAVPARTYDNLLEQIRPEWRAKSLIERVYRLLPVDPSSACQRLLNAAIHDLRSKVTIAGLDIAREMAAANSLPRVETEQDVENYSTSHILDLAQCMGLLTRPEWRKLKRAYSIRKDLEHEDDEYEAGPEDCVYVFVTCIQIVLARDPVQIVRVTDFKEIIEKPEPVALCHELLEDYEKAPKPRQVEIGKFLVSVSLDDRQPDIVRQNAFRTMQELRAITRDQARIELAAELQGKTGRGEFATAHMKVGHALGLLPYVKQKRVLDYFDAILRELDRIGYGWRQHANHGAPLGELEDVGGFEHCPGEVLGNLLEWCVLAYLGEPGGYGMGIGRPVFYSDVAAPIISRMVAASADRLRDSLKAMGDDRNIKRAMCTKHIARRFEKLLDLVEPSS